MGDLVHAGTGTNSLGPSYSSMREYCRYVQRPGELQSLAWVMQRQDASPERLLPKCLPFMASLWSPEQAHMPFVSRHADLACVTRTTLHGAPSLGLARHWALGQGGEEEHGSYELQSW